MQPAEPGEFSRRAVENGKLDLTRAEAIADLDAALHDIRGQRREQPGLYDRDSYGAAQSFARALRAAGSSGVVYDSVRHEGGECAAVFRPRALSQCRQEKHLCYVWDGMRVSEVYEKRWLG